MQLFSEAPSQNGFYLGESGIAIGTHTVTKNNITTYYNAFEVNNEGNLIARRGYIGDGENGWKIAATFLSLMSVFVLDILITTFLT